MSISKVAMLLGIALTMTSAAPAFAHKEGWEWLNMMDRLRKERAAKQPEARAQATDQDVLMGKPRSHRTLKRSFR